MYQSGLLRLEQSLAHLRDSMALAVSKSTGPARNTLASDSHGNSSMATKRRPSCSLPTIDNGGDPRAGNPHQLLELSFRAGLGGSRPQYSRVHQLEGNLGAGLAIARRHTSPVFAASDAFDRLEARLWWSGMDSSRCGPSAVAQVSWGQKFASSGYFDLQIGQVSSGT